MSGRTYEDLSPEEQARVDAEVRRVKALLAESLNTEFKGEMITDSLRAKILDRCMSVLKEDAAGPVDIMVVRDPEDPNKLTVKPGNRFTAFVMFAMGRGLRPPSPMHDSDVWYPDSDVWYPDSYLVEEVRWDHMTGIISCTYKPAPDYINIDTQIGEQHGAEL